MMQLDLLRDSRLFAECAEQSLTRLSEIARERQFFDGELVFSHGDAARELMVVVSGEIQLQLPISILGESKTLAYETKNTGEAVGWSALVPPFRFTLSARASGDTSVLVFSQTDLRDLFDSDSFLGFRVMKNLASIIAQRLHHTRTMWAREIQRSLDERYR